MPNAISNPRVERQIVAGNFAAALTHAIAWKHISEMKLTQIVHEVLTARDIDCAAFCWTEALRDDTVKEIARYSYIAEEEAEEALAKASQEVRRVA